MLFWWLTFGFSWQPLSKYIARFLLALVITRNSTDGTNLAQHFINTTVSTSTTAQPKVSDLIPGIYDFESSTNFDNYLKELGVNFVLRKLAGLATPAITISTDCKESLSNVNCQWSILTTTVFKSHEVKFKLMENKNDITMDGRQIRFLISLSASNQWTEIQTGSNNLVTTIRRNFYEDRMEVLLQVNDVTASSIFKRRQPSSEDDFFSNDIDSN